MYLQSANPDRVIIVKIILVSFNHESLAFNFPTIQMIGVDCYALLSTPSEGITPCSKGYASENTKVSEGWDCLVTVVNSQQSRW